MLKASKDLANAYYLKNEFHKFMDSDNEVVAKKRLKHWLLKAGSFNLKEFESCVMTFNNWHKEILNAFDTDFTNGFTEGCNNKIKVLKRVSYGVRNFNRFRKRILHVMAA
ncbi:MAG: transposase [Anaerovoracaceae bacterium]